MYKAKSNPQPKTGTPRCEAPQAAEMPGDTEADAKQGYQDFLDAYWQSDWQGWSWQPASASKS